jgi:hypothetical protein
MLQDLTEEAKGREFVQLLGHGLTDETGWYIAWILLPHID